MAGRTAETELRELEERYWQALRDNDVETAMHLTDDPAIIVGAQGVGSIDRQALGSMVKNAGYTLHRFELGEMQVRMLSDDIGVVAYPVHEELTVDGSAVALDACDSSTWVRRDGRWLCALHTEAISGDPFGRDRLPGH